MRFVFFPHTNQNANSWKSKVSKCQQIFIWSDLVCRFIHGDFGRIHQPAQLAVPVCKKTILPPPRQRRLKLKVRCRQSATAPPSAQYHHPVCRVGSPSYSATCQSPAGCGGHAIQPGVTEPPLVLGRGQVASTEPLPTHQVSARFRPHR